MQKYNVTVYLTKIFILVRCIADKHKLIMKLENFCIKKIRLAQNFGQPKWDTVMASTNVANYQHTCPKVECC